MRLAILTLLAAPLFLAAPVAAEPHRVPLMCGERGDPDSPPETPPPAPAALVGTYRCNVEGLVIELRLDANGRFRRRMWADPPAKGGDLDDMAEEYALSGRWRVEGNTVHLFERPVRAPAIELVESKRDPSVWMRVELREPDGKLARGLLVGQGEEANPISSPVDGVVLVPRSYGFTPGLRQVVRAGDEMRLTAFTVPRDGINSFRFVYRPSEVEPFEEEAFVVDQAASAVAVPLGIGGALLRRVGPDRR